MQSCKTEPFGTQYVTHEDGPSQISVTAIQQPSIAQHSPALPVQTNCEQLLCPSCHLLPAAVHRCALWSHGDYCYLQSRCKRANIQKLQRIHIKSTQKHSKALFIPQWCCYANHGLAKGWCTEPEQSLPSYPNLATVPLPCEGFLDAVGPDCSIGRNHQQAHV